MQMLWQVHLALQEPQVQQGLRVYMVKWEWQDILEPQEQQEQLGQWGERGQQGWGDYQLQENPLDFQDYVDLQATQVCMNEEVAELYRAARWPKCK